MFDAFQNLINRIEFSISYLLYLNGKTYFSLAMFTVQTKLKIYSAIPFGQKQPLPIGIMHTSQSTPFDLNHAYLITVLCLPQYRQDSKEILTKVMSFIHFLFHSMENTAMALIE
jgi:hypothetical protein